jgi:hypothetical protein
VVLGSLPRPAPTEFIGGDHEVRDGLPDGLPDGIASFYILDVDGQRQVFLTQYRSATSDEDVVELQTILDSIHIES